MLPVDFLYPVPTKVSVLSVALPPIYEKKTGTSVIGISLTCPSFEAAQKGGAEKRKVLEVKSMKEESIILPYHDDIR